MTTLTHEQTTDLLTMLRKLESDINAQRVIIKHDGMTQDDHCPAFAHERIKRAIQAGAHPFIVGGFAVVKL